MRFRKLLVAVFAALLITVGCHAQNGPTVPSVKLNYTQSTGNTNPVAKNCLYRKTGVAAGTYDLPAIQCSTSPSTTFTDLAVVRGTTYHYAVTAVDTNGAESAFSADLQVTSPTINPPTGLGAALISLLKRGIGIEPKNPVVEAHNSDNTLKAQAE